MVNESSNLIRIINLKQSTEGKIWVEATKVEGSVIPQSFEVEYNRLANNNARFLLPGSEIVIETLGGPFETSCIQPIALYASEKDLENRRPFYQFE